MEIKGHYTLKIDKKFCNLIQPIHREAYLRLEANIKSNGCRDPIITWRGIILDGHKRYEICQHNDIPFSVLSLDFLYREEAISWICANQLKRADISREARKFLIGVQYEMEKTIDKLHKNNDDCNLNGFNRSNISKPKGRPIDRVAIANSISHGTVTNYAEYTRTLEEIRRKAPELVTKILSGRYKFSQKNLTEISMLSKEKLDKITCHLEQHQQPYIQYKQTRQEQQNAPSGFGSGINIMPAVKVMPEFDPDAEVTGLTLTIPSWSSSIDRARKSTNLSEVSVAAKEKLLTALTGLQTRTAEFLSAIKEEN